MPSYEFLSCDNDRPGIRSAKHYGKTSENFFGKVFAHKGTEIKVLTPIWHIFGTFLDSRAYIGFFTEFGTEGPNGPKISILRCDIENVTFRYAKKHKNASLKRI